MLKGHSPVNHAASDSLQGQRWPISVPGCRLSVIRGTRVRAEDSHEHRTQAALTMLAQPHRPGLLPAQVRRSSTHLSHSSQHGEANDQHCSGLQTEGGKELPLPSCNLSLSPQIPGEGTAGTGDWLEMKEAVSRPRGCTGNR